MPKAWPIFFVPIKVEAYRVNEDGTKTPIAAEICRPVARSKRDNPFLEPAMEEAAKGISKDLEDAFLHGIIKPDVHDAVIATVKDDMWQKLAQQIIDRAKANPRNSRR